jgi:hypothetical protein
MDELLEHWRAVVARASVELEQLSEERARWRPAPDKWSTIEIVGHLIDSATNNHGRFVEAQLRPDLVFPGYPQDEWVRLQQYQQADWHSLRQLWRALNQRLIEVVAAIPKEILELPRAVHNLDEIAWKTVSRSDSTTLGYLIGDYVGHLEHHLRQIRDRLALQG